MRKNWGISSIVNRKVNGLENVGVSDIRRDTNSADILSIKMHFEVHHKPNYHDGAFNQCLK